MVEKYIFRRSWCLSFRLTTQNFQFSLWRLVILCSLTITSTSTGNTLESNASWSMDCGFSWRGLLIFIIAAIEVFLAVIQLPSAHTGAHFSTVIQILCKFHYVLIQVIVKWSLYFFFTWHNSCAVVECAKFYGVMIPYNGGTVFTFSIGFDLQWKNRSWNGPQVVLSFFPGVDVISSWE